MPYVTTVCVCVLPGDPVRQNATELCGAMQDTYWPPRDAAATALGVVVEYLTVAAPQTLTGEQQQQSRGLVACRAMLIIGRGIAAAGGIARIASLQPPLGVRFLVADYVGVDGYARGSTRDERTAEAVRRFAALGADAILPPFSDRETELVVTVGRCRLPPG